MSQDAQQQPPISGLWRPGTLQKLYYGPHATRDHLLECLPTEQSKAFIITGTSLASKTPLIAQVEAQLGARHAGTFSKIGQHAPVAQVDEATQLVLDDARIDTIISIGGGSPIDSAKAISYRLNEKRKAAGAADGGDASEDDRFLHHVCIPTTLSAAECTFIAGYTGPDGLKTGVAHPALAPQVIIYDSQFALHTPAWLVLSTALRALDHAVESLYHPSASEITRMMAVTAAGELFRWLPQYKATPEDEAVLTRLQLAAFASLGFFGLNVKGSLGLSHTLGYALGSPFGIPHGLTSCMTLGHVVKLKAAGSADDAAQIARLGPGFGLPATGDVCADARAVGDAILDLVDRLGLKTTLTEKNVGVDQVDRITKLATKQDSGPLFEKVRELVKGLY